MFAIVDKQTLKVVGTTHTAEPSDTQHFVPITKDQYVQFNNNPVYMSAQTAVERDGVITLETTA